MRVRDALPVEIGHLPPGERNAISDVPGVTVGHRTLADREGVNTGVTVIRPHDGVAFERTVRGNAFVLNGFGKSTGLMQLRELGELETPLALTNTLDVGTAANALVDHTLDAAGEDVRSVNPLVLECNDGSLNDIRGRHVAEEHVHAALDATSASVEEGVVGAGRGMTAFGRKGGIGTASRRVTVDGEGGVVGALVLANFGRLRDLRVGGVPVGRRLAGDAEQDEGPAASETDDGSVAMVVATDAPLDARQLGRVAKRAPLGMARTGGYAHHGSGDLAVAFSTAAADDRGGEGLPLVEATVPDETLDEVFEAAADATEAAILNSLLGAETVRGRDGNVVEALDVEAVEAALRAYPWPESP
jgi:D-aminopeptidase